MLFRSVHQAEFSILDASFYPNINELNSTNLLTLNGKHLVNLFEKTKFAGVQISDSTLQMNCVRVIFKPNELNLVATDSFRLLFLRDHTPCLKNKEISIPLDTVTLLCKLLKDYDDEVTLGYSNDILIVKWNESYLSSKTIALEYPDFKTILRMSSYDKTMEIGRAHV